MSSNERPGKIKQAVILGAGLGTRLRPITNTIPKVMVPIDESGKPLLEHVVEWFRDHGVEDIIINLHYLPEVITAHFANGEKFGVRIRYSDESDKLLETGGALKKIEGLLEDNFFFVFGDEMHFFDPQPLADFHIKNNALATIVLKTSDLPQNGDIGEFDPETKRIHRWHTRPHEVVTFTDTLMLNAGIYALSKKILDYIPSDTPIKFDGDILPKAFAAGEDVFAFPTKEIIFDIGTSEKYEAAKKYYDERRSGLGENKKPHS